ncbi:response regulator [Lichenibacterium dinghuense]|uniref:response regulator n=1 Tax=Lichenibacterium dinghuense TaxID=2895977 RepID=UPI00281536C9|nr:response regulator [Lichenibacterium sp. 6Y81]
MTGIVASQIHDDGRSAIPHASDVAHTRNNLHARTLSRMREPQSDMRPFALVVDDDGLLRMDVAEILEDVGFRTLEACSGDEALLVLEDRYLDVSLLFTDVEMPGDRNGFALAREVAVKWPYISVVVASGRLKPDDGDLPTGARFIGKPFSAATVRDHLREVMPDARKPDALLD